MLLIPLYYFARNYFQPTVIIVPHHNLVAQTRRELLAQIKANRPKTTKIIIIGPDHFSQNQNQISVSDSDWHLSNGNLSADRELISNLPSDINHNTNLLKDDHAVYNLLPEIKDLWSDTKIIPILIGEKVEFSRLRPLINFIQNNCNSNCLLIASIDFSHYLPASLANVHDQKSLRVLNNFEIDQIKDLEIDSPQSLFIASSVAQFKKSYFNLFSHTNSGEILSNPDSETTTHVMAYYQPGFNKIQKINTTTFTATPQKFSSSDNQKTVGQRFFYGTDQFEITSEYPGFVTAGITGGNKTTTVYLPVNINGNQLSFDTGQSKLNKVKQLFDSINCTNCNKNHIWSTITYGTN